MKPMTIRSAKDAVRVMLEIMSMSPVELEAWQNLVDAMTEEKAEELLYLLRKEQDACTADVLATVESYVAYIKQVADRRMKFLRDLSNVRAMKKSVDALLEEQHPSSDTLDPIFADERRLAEFLATLSVFELELIKERFQTAADVKGDARLTVTALLDNVQNEAFEHERRMREEMTPMVRRVSDAIMLQYYHSALQKIQ